jgi:hypothetical protein
MSTVELCSQIESHSCCILGETYTFRLQPAAMERDTRPAPPGHTVLHIEARSEIGGYSVARMRITASTQQLERIPTLLTKALEHWLAAVSSAQTVH